MSEKPIICPECGASMVLRETKKFTDDMGEPRMFYGCSRWPECTCTHGAHPTGEPMGIPGNKETRQWRMKAHSVFDPWWQKKGMKRRESYKELQKIMNMSEEDAHIAKFNIELCKTLIAKLQEIKRNENEGSNDTAVEEIHSSVTENT